MGYGWLNLGSIALGLAGWIAPWLAFAGKGRSGPGRRGLWHIVSLSCCALALWRIRLGRRKGSGKCARCPWRGTQQCGESPEHPCR